MSPDPSEGWFGRKKHERKKDHLLSYIHHARNCEEHTIGNTTAIAAEMLQAKVPDKGDFRIEFYMMVDSKGQQHYRDVKATGPNGEAMPYEFINPKPALLTVTDSRYGDKFDPPTMHRDRPIVDPTPRGVASLAINYLEEMLNEARSLPPRF